MTRRQTVIMAVIVATLATAAVVLWMVNRTAERERNSPAWLDPQQPPEGVTSPAGVSWAANRCRPMVGPCHDHTAGRRIRRTYPGTLASSDASIVAELGV